MREATCRKQGQQSGAVGFSAKASCGVSVIPATLIDCAELERPAPELLVMSGLTRKCSSGEVVPAFRAECALPGQGQGHMSRQMFQEFGMTWFGTEWGTQRLPNPLLQQ